MKLLTRLLVMGNLRRTGFGVTAALTVALALAPAIARADNTPSPDPTVMDVVDSVLAENPQPVVTPPPPTTPPAVPPAA
jgi:hypothetical protein